MGGRRDTGAENNACMCEAGGRDGGGWEANWPESGDGKAEGRGCEAGHGGRLSGLITIIIKSHCFSADTRVSTASRRVRGRLIHSKKEKAKCGKEIEKSPRHLTVM